MSEEVKVAEVKSTENKVEANVETTAPSQETKSMSFNQEQLDNIIKSRLDAEKRKHEKELAGIKQQEQEALKEKEIREAKSKQELEKLMQQRIAEKDQEMFILRSEIKKETQLSKKKKYYN